MSDTWNGTGSWTGNPTFWSAGLPPGPTTPAEIQTGTVTLSAAGNSGAFQIDAPATAQIANGGTLAVAGAASVAGFFELAGGGVASVSGGLTMTGNAAVLVDSPFNSSGGGSSLSIGGTLTNNSTNSNALYIGNPYITSADTVTATGLVNNGVIVLQGTGSVQATLNIGAAAGFGTVGVETGSVSLGGDSLLEFSTGQISTIDGVLSLDGSNSRVADSGSLNSNSALTGLTSVAGEFELGGGASVSTTGGLTLTGSATLFVDSPYNSDGGGSSLSIGGTLTNNSTNSNALYIGNPYITSADTVTATGLVNNGVIVIVGSTSVQATLNISAAAGFGTVGVETGNVYLGGDSLLEFSGGQISTIDGALSLNGSNARVADSSNTAINSALTGLSVVAGQLALGGGASVSTTGGLTLTGSSVVWLDSPFNSDGGGSSLSIGGTLTNNSTNSNALYIGNPYITSADTVTATGLVNNGEIVIVGSASVQATLNIGAAAGFGTVGVETGNVYLGGDSLLEFSGGQISTIDGALSLNGSNARVADSSNTAINSALTGLTTVAGAFELGGGASVSTTGGLTLTGSSVVWLDSPFNSDGGGSSLSIGGTLTNNSTNSNALYIGNPYITSADTVTAAGLVNNGLIAIVGSASVQATLNIGAAAGFGTVGVETGTVSLDNDSLLEFSGGQISTIDGTLSLDGSNARVADSSNTAINSALTGLTTVAGAFELGGGASVSTTGGLTLTGSAVVWLDSPFNSDGGGSSLSIGGTLTNNSTNSNALYIGNPYITSADTVTAAGLVNNGLIAIVGSASVQATLNIGAAAGFGTVGVETGTVSLDNDSLLEFSGGQISTIDGTLSLDGSNARVADSSNTAINSALTGLTTVAGAFELGGGASVSTTGGLTLTGSAVVWLDSPFNSDGGGSSLSIGGTLTNNSTNSNALYIGNPYITSADTVTAAGLVNNGIIQIQGHGANIAALDVNGAATNNDAVNIYGSGEIVMGAGDTYTQAAGYTSIYAGGTLSAPTIAVTGGYLDGTGTVVGTVDNTAGTIVGGISFGTPGTLTIDGNYDESGTGTLGVNIAYGGGSAGVVALANGYYDNLSGGTLYFSSTPQVGVLMTVMTFQPGYLVGQFANVQDGSAIGNGSFVNLGDGTTIEVFYNNSSGTIQIERVENSSLVMTYEWDTGTGNWSTAADWSMDQTPNPTANLIIGSTSTGNVTLNNSSGDQTVASLTILASNALTISGVTLTSATGGTGISVTVGGTLTLSGGGEINGSVLSGGGLYQVAAGTSGVLAGDTISAGTTFVAQVGSTLTLLGPIDNVGSIVVDGGGGSNTIVAIADAATLSGGGTVTLDTVSGGASVYVEGNGQTLTNLNDKIQGTGIIGNGSLALINAGIVDATPEGGTSTLTLNLSGGVTNTGTLEATGGGVLVLNTTVDNAGGTIYVDGTSTVEVYNGDIQGGTLTAASGGTLETIGTSTLDGTTQGALTISTGSLYSAGLGTTTALYGSIVNKGTIALTGGSGSNTILTIGNAVTLSGGGTLTLDTNSGGANVYVEGNGHTLTNTNDKIQGTGIIGNSSLVLVNQSVVDATPEGGTSTLTINTSGGVTNTGTLEATGGGVLQLSATVNNAGGTIFVDATSTVENDNGDIQGGTLTNAAGGTLETVGSSILDGTTHGALTLSTGSIYTAGLGTTTALYGSIVNKGTIALTGGNGSNTIVNIDNAVTLSGGGVVTLDSESGGADVYIQGNGQTLTNSNNTIQGTGFIGNSSLVLVNNSIVDATPEGGTSTLVLNGGGVTNTGTLEATAGGTLTIDTGVTNTGAVILASSSGMGAASVVDIGGGVTIVGGTLKDTGTGIVETTYGSSAVLQGVTVASGSTYTATNSASTTLLGTIDNLGSIVLIGGSGNNSFLLIGNAVTLTGSGTVTLDTVSGGGTAFIQGNGQTLTNANNTIQGTGVIGNGTLVLINKSVIDATPEGSTSTLTINASGGVTNTGTLEATGGGVLVLTTTVDNAGGTVFVGGTSTVEVESSIQGGTLTNAAGGTLETVGSATLDGSTYGALTISTGSIYTASNNTNTYLDGSIVNNGTIAANGGGGSNGFLLINNAVTLSGGGVVTLSTATGGGDAFIQGNGNSLTNTNNTIQGTGIIGDGNLVLVNNSVIDATPEGGTSTLLINTSGAVTNTATLEAKSGGVLQLYTTVDNAGGTIYADGTSTIQLYGDIQGGTLIVAAGGTFETVSTAYLDGTTHGALTISTGSVYTAADGTNTTLYGSIVNKGTIDLDGGNGNNAYLNIANAVTLSGGGTVLLTQTAASGGTATIQGNGNTLTNTNNIIEGSGLIGNGNLVLINSSVIDATPEGGTSTLLINTSGGVTNTGTLEATGGGVLQLNTTVNNAGGTIYADGTSIVEVYSGDIQGGTLTAAAGGMLETVANATLDGTTQGALTISAGSVYTAADGTTTTLYGSIVNKGTIDLDGGNGNNAYLNIANAVTLSGGGVVLLTQTAASGGTATIQGNGNTLTNTNDTIAGSGLIGNGNLVLVNGGVIDATPEGGTSTLTINTTGSLTNTGTLEATGGGTLSITSDTVTNNGTVVAMDNSAVTFGAGVTTANNASGVLTGGVWGAISTGDGATLSITGGAVTTDAATIILSGTGSVFQSYNGSTYTTLENSLTTITSAGTLEVLGSRGYSSSLALAVGGLLQLGGGTFATASLTVNGGGKLFGFGNVTPSVANAGTIEANGGDLDLTAGASGTGALIADAGATLELGATTTAGAVTANGEIKLDGVTLTPTSFTIATTGLLYGFGTVASGIADAGKIEANGGTLKVTGVITGAGTLQADSGATLELAAAATTGTVIDNGTIKLDGITLTATSATIGSGGHLFGYGTVASPIANAGTIEANGGTLKVTGVITGAGTLQADSGATLELAAAATTGKVVDNGIVKLDGITLTASSSTTIASGADLVGTGTVAGTIANAGTIEASGGLLTIDNSVTGSGSIQVDAGATLSLLATTSAGAVTANGNLDLTNNLLTATSVTIGTAGGLLGYGEVTAAVTNNGLIAASNYKLLEINGTVSGSGSLLAGGYGTLELAGNTTAGTVTSYGYVELAGITLTATSVIIEIGGYLAGSGTVAAPITNSGTIGVNPYGLLKLTGTVTGSSGLLVSNGNSTLELAGTTSAGTVVSGGVVQLDGITLTASSVTVSSGAYLLGSGTVVSGVSNSGTIEAKGGTLKVTGAITGSGALVANSGATLELAGTTSAKAVTDNGIVKLDGITLTPTSVSVASGADLLGYGTVASPIANAGTIEANGGTLKVTGAITGAGTLQADSGATLELAAAATTGKVVDNGIVKLDGITLTASSSTTIASGADLVGTGTVAGTIANAGTIEASGGLLTIDNSVTGSGSIQVDAGATLSLLGTTSAGAVTANGNLDLTNNLLTATSVTIGTVGGLLGYGEVTAAVTNNGLIAASNYKLLEINGTVSGSGSLLAGGYGTLELAGNTTAGTVTSYGYVELAGITLTATSVIIEIGGYLAGSGTVAAPITNSGTIGVNPYGSLKLAGTVTGSSGLLVSNGNSTLELAGTTSAGTVVSGGVVQLDGITLTASSVTVSSGAYLLGSGTVASGVSDSGTIEANGGTLKVTGAITGSGALVANSGATLELAGTTSAKAVTDNGIVKLDGITLTPTSVSVASGADLLGYGTVSSAVTNGGTIEANGGKLDVTGAVTGTGTLQIDNGQTLEVGSTVASTQTTVFQSSTGLLSLDAPSGFHGSISGFTGSDEIYLGGQVGTSLGYAYGTNTTIISVNGSGGTIATLTFNGTYAMGSIVLDSTGKYVLDPPVTSGTTGVAGTLSFINAAGGNDLITIPTAGASMDQISGFSLTNGDVLDFSGALHGTDWDGVTSQLSNYITATQSGGNTDLYFDSSGQGHGSLVAVLDNVQTSVSSLLAHNAIHA